MALCKSIMTPYGVNATYHHICEVNWDKTVPKMRVQLASYATPDARNAEGGIPLGRCNVLLDATPDLPTIADLYAAVKEQTEWSDAGDC